MWERERLPACPPSLPPAPHLVGGLRYGVAHTVLGVHLLEQPVALRRVALVPRLQKGDGK
eukprot:307068-Chlamydomonas_euryale.AAC.5